MSSRTGGEDIRICRNAGGDGGAVPEVVVAGGTPHEIREILAIRAAVDIYLNLLDRMEGDERQAYGAMCQVCRTEYMRLGKFDREELREMIRIQIRQMDGETLNVLCHSGVVSRPGREALYEQE